MVQEATRLRQGILLFNRREFFECHEVLEEEWTPERGPRRLFLQSLIHMAVGLYHASRNNPAGASRQLRKGLRKLAAYLPCCEGIDTARLHRDAFAVLERIESAESFEPPRIHLVTAVVS
jgi:predicted metal-dependent hydrolase